ncbi:MAG: MlaD family protein [Acidobacteriota bacterium]
MRPDGGSRQRVGLVVILALLVLAAAIFLIGREGNLFSPKNRYFTRFANVSGLQSGNPVQLNGVDVGNVEKVVLPENAGETTIRVWIAIDRRYAERIREDSEARIKTLGLLGDKFVEITSGSPDKAAIPTGSEIRVAPATSVDALLASGEDTVDNVVAISSSLRTVLERMERGEGLVGELTSRTEKGARLTESVVTTMETIERIADRIETGDGAVARLINDQDLADRLSRSVATFDDLMASVREGEGLVPRLLQDESYPAQLDETLSSLRQASTDLAAFTERLDGSSGLVDKLLTDEAYAEEVSENLRQLVERLNRLSGQLTEGDGTAARLIADPQVYEALNDVIVGINESRLLRWLIRNRQKAGIEKRYDEARAEDSSSTSPR